MRQHSIDLLPDSIRARSEAGLRASRFVMAGVVAIGLFLMVVVHSFFSLSSAQENQFDVSSQAEQVFAAEARASELKAALDRTNAFTDLYDRLALPINISAVMATVINTMPPSVTLDQFDIDAGAPEATRTPRSKGFERKEESVARVLKAEVSGFAATDQHIAELVSQLSSMAPFREVNLDFSRTRVVNGRDAREFRLSLRIDLDASYLVAYNRERTSIQSAKELANVQ